MAREKPKVLEQWPDKVLRKTVSIWQPIMAFIRIIKEIRKRSNE